MVPHPTHHHWSIFLPLWLPLILAIRFQQALHFLPSFRKHVRSQTSPSQPVFRFTWKRKTFTKPQCLYRDEGVCIEFFRSCLPDHHLTQNNKLNWQKKWTKFPSCMICIIFKVADKMCSYLLLFFTSWVQIPLNSTLILSFQGRRIQEPVEDWFPCYWLTFSFP